MTALALRYILEVYKRVSALSSNKEGIADLNVGALRCPVRRREVGGGVFERSRRKNDEQENPYSKNGPGQR
jgi:hypothetical protein